MKIVVTGSAGYVGQPLVARLAALGHHVTGIDLCAAPHTLRADIRGVTRELFEGADAVVHLAGVSFAPEWDDADDLIWDVNVKGTRRLLALCQSASVPRFVFASSASVYEGRTEPATSVNDPAAAVSLYGRSKVAGEHLLSISEIPQRIALRKGTLCGLGPHPRLDLLTNSMSVSALRYGQVYVDGAGYSHRPILRLERAVENYVAAATTEAPNGMHLANICDDNVQVIHVARQIAKLTGAEVVHRPPRGRARTYRVFSGRTPGARFADMAPVTAQSIVQGVLAETRMRLSELPDASHDPRVDRLAMIREARALANDEAFSAPRS